MDEETLEALEASITKWEGYSRASSVKEVDLGPDNCPLCRLFHYDGCEVCPVAEETGRALCYDSPYDTVVGFHEDWQGDEHSDQCRDDFRAAAQAEVDFLRSLLPEDKP